MLQKSTKRNLVRAILSLVVFVLGVGGIEYYENVPRNAKLQIANVLNLEDINEVTINDDVRCQFYKGVVTVKYKKKNVYYARMVDDEMMAFEVEPNTFIPKTTVARGWTPDDEVIISAVKRIEAQRQNTLVPPLIVFFFAVCEFLILIIFDNFDGKENKI